MSTQIRAAVLGAAILLCGCRTMAPAPCVIPSVTFRVMTDERADDYCSVMAAPDPGEDITANDPILGCFRAGKDSAEVVIGEHNQRSVLLHEFDHLTQTYCKDAK